MADQTPFDRTSFGAWLLARRMSVTRFAEEVGIPRNTFRSYIFGETAPAHYFVYTIARVMGLLVTIPEGLSPTQRDEAVVGAVRAYFPATRNLPGGLTSVFARRELSITKGLQQAGLSGLTMTYSATHRRLTERSMERLESVGITREEIVDCGLKIQTIQPFRAGRPPLVTKEQIAAMREQSDAMCAAIEAEYDRRDEIAAEMFRLIDTLPGRKAKKALKERANGKLRSIDWRLKPHQTKEERNAQRRKRRHELEVKRRPDLVAAREERRKVRLENKKAAAAKEGRVVDEASLGPKPRKKRDRSKEKPTEGARARKNARRRAQRAFAREMREALNPKPAPAPKPVSKPVVQKAPKPAPVAAKPVAKREVDPAPIRRPERAFVPRRNGLPSPYPPPTFADSGADIVLDQPVVTRQVRTEADKAKIRAIEEDEAKFRESLSFFATTIQSQEASP